MGSKDDIKDEAARHGRDQSPKIAVFQGWGSTTLSRRLMNRKVLMRNPIFSGKKRKRRWPPE